MVEITPRRKTLIEEALADTGIQAEERPYGYKIDVQLQGGRKQTVRVAFDARADSDQDKLILVYSPCAPARPEAYKWALKLNHGLGYGRVAIETTTEGEVFVFMHALLESATDPVELRKTIMAIATKADWVELQLTKADNY
jgi:serine/threonine-protein kinase